MAWSLVALAAPLVALVVLPDYGEAQVKLGSPTGSLPDDFGSIQTVRELRDGQVLVADPLSKALYLVDLDAATRTQVGRESGGPNE